MYSSYDSTLVKPYLILEFDDSPKKSTPSILTTNQEFEVIETIIPINIKIEATCWKIIHLSTPSDFNTEAISENKLLPDSPLVFVTNYLLLTNK